jgi:hypothetical protein
MKIFYFFFFLGTLTGYDSFAQNTLNATGNAGVGTTSPTSGLVVQTEGANVTDGALFLVNGVNNGFGGGATIAGIKTTAGDGGQYNFLKLQNAGGLKLIVNGAGNMGIGISVPQTKMHIVGSGAGLDAGNLNFAANGGMLIQANSGGRSMTTGPQLEFALPANTDGSNSWGQARIITVAANANTSDATGKMILGTRRSFDKLGAGIQWYYGNDLVIDGAGNIGIGTLTPKEALSVNGNIRSKQVKVEIMNWPDYVFDYGYHLPSLLDVAAYINLNKHLPDIPSADDIAKEGLNLGEMNKILVKKVEELTLYLIEKDKREQESQAELQQLKQEVAELKKMVIGNCKNKQ